MYIEGAQMTIFNMLIASDYYILGKREYHTIR